MFKSIIKMEWKILKNNLKKYKYLYLVIILLVLIVAGIADLKYEGLFYKMLPDSIQDYVNEIL